MRGEARFLLALAALSTSYARPAHGGEPEGDAMLDRGVDLRAEGRDREALVEFERAFAAHRSARARAQIALAHQALGAWVEAEAGLVEALAAHDDTWIARNRAPLEEALAVVRRHLAWIEIESNVDGAELVIDGVPTGRLPQAQATRVVTGVHVVEVLATGFEPSRRRVDMDADARAHEVLTLVPVRRDATAPAPAGAARAMDPPSRTALWITVGSGGALTALGIGAQIARENSVAIYNDDSRCRYGGVPRDDRCGTYRRSANAATIVMIAGYVGAGVAAIGAGVLLAMSSPARAPRASYVRCGVGAGAWSLQCGGAF